jgi:hypothetical protein
LKTTLTPPLIGSTRFLGVSAQGDEPLCQRLTTPNCEVPTSCDKVREGDAIHSAQHGWPQDVTTSGVLVR